MGIIDNYYAVIQKITDSAIASGRNPEDVKLVSVSKTYPADIIQNALDSGITLFGENKVQEAKEKIPLLKGSFDFHLIGHLQSNKAKDAVTLFSTIHSIDKYSTACKVSEEASKINKNINVLIQVNTSGESTKSGISPEAACELCVLTSALPYLTLTGLMTIGPLTDDRREIVKSFSTLRKLRDDINGSLTLPMKELSMGMSGDFVDAINEGSTILRIGSAIFGMRNYNNG